MTDRKEVAKKLCEAGERLDKEAPRDILAAAICVLHEFLDATDIRENNSYSAVFSSLADLIDPACKPVEAGNNIVCSECGADLYDDDLYCSRCGARVVRRND